MSGSVMEEMPTRVVLTYRDYEALPADGRRYELHDGELPDLVFLESERPSVASPRGIEGAPTLAIEIVSRSTARVDRGAKLQLYARYGISHYWIADPEARNIEAHVLALGAYRVAGRLGEADRGSLPPLEGLTIALDTLWA